MTIFVASDHGGFKLKEKVKQFLIKKNYVVKDLGCDSAESSDYPVFGKKIGEKIPENLNSRGIAICGSGIGIGIAINKVKGVRCVTANSVELAKLGREHNGAQVLAMGERTQFIDPWEKIVETFLNTEIIELERHQRRRQQLDEM